MHTLKTTALKNVEEIKKTWINFATLIKTILLSLQQIKVLALVYMIHFKHLLLSI